MPVTPGVTSQPRVAFSKTYLDMEGLNNSLHFQKSLDMSFPKEVGAVKLGVPGSSSIGGE